jgi:hypothetical protein
MVPVDRDLIGYESTAAGSTTCTGERVPRPDQAIRHLRAGNRRAHGSAHRGGVRRTRGGDLRDRTAALGSEPLAPPW